MELNSEEVKSEVFYDKGLIKQRAQLLKKLTSLTQELERAEEEVSEEPINQVSTYQIVKYFSSHYIHTTWYLIN